ncbi:hypothetical protein DBV05_g5372 [Lasiodiplodia theobromae]|uniref:CMP/dCMP-type deaminase domain-containing protein n=1 Tax=Lasiodiplodia theobromae TaxID=45133 RepID=A0A5N5DDU8_9PEZI|nr:hypothetical protein DBV05_g5372 [Lasiodiplodia theobromae]
MTKSDHYLSLCLSQAAHSPLHYRHGCVIVRGGKVIGAGHNDYRPGYDGGALKTGVLPKHHPKPKRKPKKNDGNHHGFQAPPPVPQPAAGHTFTPFEEMGRGGGGYGKHATAPFSMHAEMMAIADAVGRSSSSSQKRRGALARRALEGEKPRAKLSGGGASKRKGAVLERGVLERYVERVCREWFGGEQEKEQRVQGREGGVWWSPASSAPASEPGSV